MISTHVLDVSEGRPASGIPVRLESRAADSWTLLNSSKTDQDGRCRDLLGQAPSVLGDYRLIFETAPYFAAKQITALYPEIVITFSLRDQNQDFHLPLLLTANSYTTYRGS